MRFNLDSLRPGLIVHGRRTAARSFGGWIRVVLSVDLIQQGLRGVWGNHDALVVTGPDGNLGIGDAIGNRWPFRCKVTSLADYERSCTAGDYSVRLYEVIGATPGQEQAAADWWMLNVFGTFYDFKGIWYLFWSTLLGRASKRARQWEWAHWCTEGVARAYQLGAKINAYLKDHATPLTTEKRGGEYGGPALKVTLHQVTDQMVKPFRPCRFCKYDLHICQSDKIRP